MRARSVLFAAFFAPCMAGCGDEALPPVFDLAAENCDAHPIACGCADDSACSRSTPRCDRNTGRCVPCLPLDDNCPAGQRCVAGAGTFSCTAACRSDADCPRSDAGASLLCCNEVCVDATTDVRNCGACAKACFVPPHASASCTAAVCGLGPCDSGYLDCDGMVTTGCEVESTTDLKNCGGCGKTCEAGPHQSIVCAGGQCMASCLPGYAHCSGNPNDGCEVDTQGDLRHCSGCGKACGPLAHAMAACMTGVCSIAGCDPGFGDCDLMVANGCEDDLTQDAANCGGCGKACALANAVAACKGARCAVASCAAGFADCDSLAPNGCEIALAGDVKNCGACGRSCGGAKSVQACMLGACAVISCDAGFADCDGQPATGCEVSLATDLKNCGACGNTCAAVPNGSAGCAAGKCGVAMCNQGFADCNMDPKDGCEADLLSTQSCGKCGVVCMALANASTACKAGQCAIGMCNALFGDCDNNPANGCEKPLASDIGNCGGCGKACVYANAQGACANGQCAFAMCNPGFTDCDKNPANGCEINTTFDPKNCGACGAPCPANQACDRGVCKNGIKVLLIHAEGNNANFTDVQKKLLFTGAIGTADLFDAFAATPSVMQMQAYDAVLVWSNLDFANTKLLGDSLATYFDGGGNVVIAVHAIGGIPSGLIGGRFGNPANGYILLQPIGPGVDASTASLGMVAEPMSPLMAGVVNLDAKKARRGLGAVVNGGTVVARWSDGKPLIIRGVVQGRNRADLNMSPVSFDGNGESWTGDGAIILKNALTYR